MGREHVTPHMHSIDGEIQTWRTYYKYSSFRIWIFYDETGNIQCIKSRERPELARASQLDIAVVSYLIQGSGTRGKKRCIASSEGTAVERILTDAHSLPPSKSQVFFGPEGRYTRMSSLLLSATCEGCCWIGLKPRFTLGPRQGTLRNQLCMRMSLPFHIWMLLKLVSGSHV